MKHLILFSTIIFFLSCSARKHPTEKNVGKSFNKSSVSDSSVNRVKYDLKKDSAKMDFEVQTPAPKASPTNNDLLKLIMAYNGIITGFVSKNSFFSTGKSFIMIQGIT